MKKKLILMAGLMTIGLSAHANPLVFPEGDVHASHTLGKVTVSHDDAEGYRVITETGNYAVPSINVDSSIRDLTNDQLSKALGKMYLTVKGDDENDLSLGMNVRGLGGGPATGAVIAGSYAPAGAAVGGAVAGPVGAVVGGAVAGTVGFLAGLFMPTP